MNDKKAIELTLEYLNNHINMDMSILGKDHPFYESTVGEIKNAVDKVNNILNNYGKEVLYLKLKDSYSSYGIMRTTHSYDEIEEAFSKIQKNIKDYSIDDIGTYLKDFEFLTVENIYF